MEHSYYQKEHSSKGTLIKMETLIKNGTLISKRNTHIKMEFIKMEHSSKMELIK